MEVITFACSICGESSHRICAFCTKDACGNHLCQRCLRCSDCCLCESPASGDEEEEPVAKAEPRYELAHDAESKSSTSFEAPARPLTLLPDLH